MPGGPDEAWPIVQRCARGDRGENRRRAVRDACRARRRRPLRQDGAQRHRVRRHAADRRGMGRAAARPGDDGAGDGRRVRSRGMQARSSRSWSNSPRRCAARSIPRPGSRSSTSCSTRPDRRAPGAWTAQVALDLGVAIPTIAAAIDARVLSSMKQERVAAAAALTGPSPADAVRTVGSRRRSIDDLRDALYAARICALRAGHGAHPRRVATATTGTST